MGSSIAPGFGLHGPSGSFYGNFNAPILPVRPEGQRTMPGGPLLPRLPRNPFAIAVRRTVGHSIPHLPNRYGRTL